MQLKACKETNAKQKCLWAERKLLDALKRINYLVFILYITKKNITKLCIRLKSSEKKVKQSDAKTERKQLKSTLEAYALLPLPHKYTHTRPTFGHKHHANRHTHTTHTHTRAFKLKFSIIKKVK